MGAGGNGCYFHVVLLFIFPAVLCLGARFPFSDAIFYGCFKTEIIDMSIVTLVGFGELH